MGDDIDPELDKLFKKYNANAEAQAEQRKKEAIERADSRSAFEAIVNEVIRPIFEQYESYIKSRGLHARIEDKAQVAGERPRDSSIALKFAFASERLYRNGCSQISIVHDSYNHRKVRFHKAVYGASGGGQSGSDGEMGLEEITAEEVERRTKAMISETLKGPFSR